MELQRYVTVAGPVYRTVVRREVEKPLDPHGRLLLDIPPLEDGDDEVAFLRELLQRDPRRTFVAGDTY